MLPFPDSLPHPTERVWGVSDQLRACQLGLNHDSRDSVPLTTRRILRQSPQGLTISQKKAVPVDFSLPDES